MVAARRSTRSRNKPVYSEDVNVNDMDLNEEAVVVVSNGARSTRSRTRSTPGTTYVTAPTNGGVVVTPPPSLKKPKVRVAKVAKVARVAVKVKAKAKVKPSRKRPRARARTLEMEEEDNEESSVVDSDANPLTLKTKRNRTSTKKTNAVVSLATETATSSPYFDAETDDGEASKSPMAAKKATKTAKKVDFDVDDQTGTNKNAAKKVTKKTRTAPKKTAKPKPKFDKDEPEENGAAARTKPAAKTMTKKATEKVTKKAKAAAKTDDDDEAHSVSSDSDSLAQPNENEHKPPSSGYTVEPSPSGRAVCRRCDTKILKSVLRVGHQPLFRGKPGFVVFRHLNCATFGNNVTKGCEVDGFQDLSREEQAVVELRVKAAMEELVEEQREIDTEELTAKAFTGETRKQPETLLGGTLLPFQVEGLSWMVHQELKTDIRGGILADEMGMGKTVQTIALLLDHETKLQRCVPHAKLDPELGTVEVEELRTEEGLWDGASAAWEHEMIMQNVPKAASQQSKTTNGHVRRGGTLVICPLVALSQWKSEILKFTSRIPTDPAETNPITPMNVPVNVNMGCVGGIETATGMTVCIYHGPNRAKELPPEKLAGYDVVLTTYQVLQADMRKMVSPNRVTCPNCKGKFKLDKLRVHLKYFCGEHAQRTEAQARQVRATDRPANTGGSGGGKKGNRNASGNGNGRGRKSMSKQKSFPSTQCTPCSTPSTPSTPSTSTKKKVKVKGTAMLASESELSDMDESEPDDDPPKSVGRTPRKPLQQSSSSTFISTPHLTSPPARPRQRSSRKAAIQASSNLSKTAKDALDGDDDDDESVKPSEIEEPSDDDDEDDYRIDVSDDEDTVDENDDLPIRSRQTKSRNTKPSNKAAGKNSKTVIQTNRTNTKLSPKFQNESSSSSSSSEQDSDSEAERRATARQREALETASKRKGKGKKTFSNKTDQTKEFKEEKKAHAAKKKSAGGAKMKKFKGDDDSSSDDEHDYKAAAAIAAKKKKEDVLSKQMMDKLLKQSTQGSQMSILHSILWWRIVLDEAHYIKSRSSQTSAAAFALTGIHRWCLSGTPLQNRVGEFYSLIRFLRIDPMAHYCCKAKDCNCKSIHYRMVNGVCLDCGHRNMQHYSHFNKYVLNPIQTDGYSGDGRRAMFVLKNEVLDKALLRRTKTSRAEDMNLPPRIVSVRYVRLHPIEEDFYNALYTQGRAEFNDYVSNGTLLNNYAHIFDLLMRMRQAVDHPYLVVYSKKDMAKAAAIKAEGALTPSECEICHEPTTDRVISTCCRESFCRSCVLEYMSTSAGLGGNSNTSGGIPCPSCRSPFSIDMSQASQATCQDNNSDYDKLSLNKNSIVASPSIRGIPSLKELRNVSTTSILRRINLAEFATCTKIEALTEELLKMRRTSPGSKAIVFSQFVNMLDLIRWRIYSDPCLQEAGLGAKALHGSMDLKSRDASLKAFREDPNSRVLLISLKAGGVALNLTVANHIFLMDPWWNPAAEMQAIDRTHRLGQYRPIRAVRFIAEDTVEERILQLQEKKRLVFDGTVGRDAASLNMLTVDDMRSLFA